MVKTRYFPEVNYAAMFDGKQTFRFEVDGEMKKPPYPEFYDIAINNLCYGNCSYCYVAATKNGKNFDNVAGKIKRYFGPMNQNERPFQVALGGHGEPTLHPDFCKVLETFAEWMEVVPNYTTNGMHLSDEVLEATTRWAGGVAVSTHPHLPWARAVDKLISRTEVHLHCIISDKASVDWFLATYERFSGIVSTFVLLPYRPIGRAVEVETDFDYLFDVLEERQFPDVAYGAYFYEELVKRPALNASLYIPHMFSKYLILDDPVTEHRSSFDVDPRSVNMTDEQFKALEKLWDSFGLSVMHRMFVEDTIGDQALWPLIENGFLKEVPIPGMSLLRWTEIGLSSFQNEAQNRIQGT